MKKYVAVLFVCVTFSSFLFAFLPVRAQEPIEITDEIIITPYDDIVPNTSLLERNGNIYTLKENIIGSVWIQANNIILDGAGHTLQYLRLKGSNLQGPSDPDCTSITIKNLKIIHGSMGAVGSGNHTFIDSYFEHSEISFIGALGVGDDVFKNNTFVDVTFTLTYGGGSRIVMSENNFVNIKMVAFGTYFPKLDRNYYNDYTLKYPNATQVNNLNIWNTPYVMPIEEPGYPKSNTVDNYPIVNPVANLTPNSNTPITTLTQQINDDTSKLIPIPLVPPTNFVKYVLILIIIIIVFTVLYCTLWVLEKKPKIFTVVCWYVCGLWCFLVAFVYVKVASVTF